MIRRLNFATTAAILLLSTTVAIAQPRAPQKIEILPNSDDQNSLAALKAATDRTTFEAELSRLLNRIGSDHARAVEQLLWFSAKNGNDEKNSAVVGRLIKSIGMTNESMIRALVPHLDNLDSAIAEHAANWLRGCEDHSAVRPPDFSTYRAIIEEDVRADLEPGASLVRHMVRSDAGTALLTMVRAVQLRDPAEIRPILWGEHVVADLLWQRQHGFVGPKDTNRESIAEIGKLARHKFWWVRLYVAEIVRQHPELAAPGVRAGLMADVNQIVRDTAGETEKPK